MLSYGMQASKNGVGRLDAHFLLLVRTINVDLALPLPSLLYTYLFRYYPYKVAITRCLDTARMYWYIAALVSVGTCV